MSMEWSKPHPKQVFVRTRKMISRKHAIVMVLILAGIVLFGYKRINADQRLQSIKGKWTHRADNNQLWSYKFKDDKVHFSIDHQTTQWPVAGIEESESSVLIRVNDPGTELIKVTKLSSDQIVISSRLHCPMMFKR